MDNANQVVESDLEYICNELEDEFSQMEGKKLLIVGGDPNPKNCTKRMLRIS